jgi:hypothetical protein
MNLVIPLYMLAEWQALDFYPNMIGQLELAMHIQSRYAVWAVLDPRKVSDVKAFFEDSPVGIDWTTLNGLPISRKFAQIGNPLNVITSFTFRSPRRRPLRVPFVAKSGFLTRIRKDGHMKFGFAWSTGPYCTVWYETDQIRFDRQIMQSQRQCHLSKVFPDANTGIDIFMG